MKREDIPNLSRLLEEAGVDPVGQEIVPALIVVAAEMIQAWKDKQHGLMETEEQRLIRVLEVGAKRFVALAALSRMMKGE